MQSNGWEIGQSGNNSSEDDGAGLYMILQALTTLDLTDRETQAMSGAAINGTRGDVI